MDSRKVALEALAAGRLPAGTSTEGVPRLRFDRVAQRLQKSLQQVLAEVPSATTTLVVTVTAPIRLPGSTVEELAGRIRRPLRRNFSEIVGGNQVRARLVPRRVAGAPRVIVFVHNPEPAPARLFELAAAWLLPRSGTPRGKVAASSRRPSR
jgi:hypothetical protein